MRRRNALGTLAGMSTTAMAQTAGWNNAFAKQWRDTFIHHWQDTRTYTLAIFDAMPADGMEVKPNPAQRGFADQFDHIARANNAYFKAFNIGQAPEPPKVKDRDSVRTFLAASFDWIDEVLRKMTEKELVRADYKFSPRLPPHSGTDLCMRAYMHTAHHRGQAVVYLRVKGITPPAWKFEPSGT
ncbi:MAG: DinB family protein [Bryobacteraceae bacterium]|nr:DinB family protein [Bryobacteraceae bacterium]